MKLLLGSPNAMWVLMINCKSTFPGLYKDHFYDVFIFICSCISSFHSYHDHFSAKDVAIQLQI